MLRVGAIDVAYGPVPVLRGLSLSVASGEIVCLMGRNGAGKTTCLRAIMGLAPVTAGRIDLDDLTLTDLAAHRVPKAGIGYVPQGRRLFTDLTVAENLEIGLMARGSPRSAMARALDLFPRLRDRMGQRSGTLSGGEQQMLAMARALCVQPRLMLLDEPTEGLQPTMIAAIRDVVVRLKSEGVGILLVEQRIDAVLSVADRVVLIENGENRETLEGAEARADPAVLRSRLGV
jgi:branched-chain amino acid transport system ATP-binding protein